MLSQMDLEDTIKELEHYEVCDYIDALVRDKVTNAGGNDDDNDSISFNKLWLSTIGWTDGPVPRVVHPHTDSKAQLLHKHITYFSNQDTSHAAHQLGLPLIMCFNGSFSCSGSLPYCGCNHCETCFHNNVLSLRKLMFGQKKAAVSEETRLASSSGTGGGAGAGVTCDALSPRLDVSS